MGGELEITGKNGNQRLYFPADIPATEFVIVEIKVLAVREFGDEHLPMFVGLPRLRSIFNAHTATTDEGMKAIGEIETLHGLGCGGNKITAAGIGHLTKLKFIRFLDVNDSPLITNDVFKHLYNMPSSLVGSWRRYLDLVCPPKRREATADCSRARRVERFPQRALQHFNIKSGRFLNNVSSKIRRKYQ